jgi:hypothetical protein
MLQAAYSPNWREMMAPFWTSAYGGHYAPLAFSLEFLSARIFGFNELPWSVRDALILAVLIVAIGQTMRSIAVRVWPLGGRKFALVGFLSISLALSANISVMEMLSWPFMWMQFACLACMAISLNALVSFISEPARKKAFMCVLSAYASMHFFGVGIAISSAALVSLSLAAWSLHKLSEARLALVLGSALTVVHAVPSALNSGGQNGPVQVLTSFKRYFSLIVAQPTSTFTSTFIWPFPSIPTSDSIGTQTIFGLAFFVALTLTMFAMWFSAYRSRSPRSVVVAASFTFPCLAFFATCLLIVGRLRAEVGDHVLAGFTIGPRYLIFPLVFSAFALPLVIPPNRFTAGLGVAAAFTSALATALVVHTLAPVVWPDRLRSHQEMWDRIVANASEDISLNGYGEFGGSSCLYAHITGGAPCAHPVK